MQLDGWDQWWRPKPQCQDLRSKMHDNIACIRITNIHVNGWERKSQLRFKREASAAEPARGIEHRPAPFLLEFNPVLFLSVPTTSTLGIHLIRSLILRLQTT